MRAVGKYHGGNGPIFSCRLQNLNAPFMFRLYLDVQKVKRMSNPETPKEVRAKEAEYH